MSIVTIDLSAKSLLKTKRDSIVVLDFFKQSKETGRAIVEGKNHRKSIFSWKEKDKSIFMSNTFREIKETFPIFTSVLKNLLYGMSSKGLTGKLKKTTNQPASLCKGDFFIHN